MGTKDVQLDELVANLMWMREVLIYRLREIREKAGITLEEQKTQFEEYAVALRQVILDMGDLLDRVGVDVATDDPDVASQVRAYLGKRA